MEGGRAAPRVPYSPAGTSLDGKSPGFANVEEHSLPAVCFTAMAAVFVLLAFLAVIIRLISVVFPEKLTARPDSTMLAAVATTVASVYPGWQVTRIAEEQ